MATIRSFRDLEVWRLAMELTLDVYALGARFPAEERYGLSRDARRSASSIVSNIAEGHNRKARRAYRNHICIALGSQAELETQLELAVRLGYVARADMASVLDKLARTGQMLHGLRRRLAPIDASRVTLALLAFALAALQGL